MGKLGIFTVLVAAFAMLGAAVAEHDAAFWSQQPLQLGNDYFVRSLTPLPDQGLLVAGDWLRVGSAADGPTSPFRKVFIQSHREDGAMSWNLSLNAQGSAEFAQLGQDAETGDLIAVGRSWPAEGHPDMFAVRISESGRVRWLREYREQGTQQANAVAVIDGDGAVIAGSTIPLRDVPAEPDGLLVRIDADGREVWRYQTDTTAHTSFTDVAVHADGRIAVAGRTYSGSESDVASATSDIILLTFSSAGELLWQEQFGSDDADVPFRLVLDADANLVLLGSTAGALGASSGSVDFFLTRYSTDGEQEWLQQFGGNGEDKVLALATDESGRVFVGGIISIHAGDEREHRSASLTEVSASGVRPLVSELRIDAAIGGSTILLAGGTPSLLLSVNAGEGWRLMSLPEPEVFMEPADSTGS